MGTHILAKVTLSLEITFSINWKKMFRLLIQSIQRAFSIKEHVILISTSGHFNQKPVIFFRRWSLFASLRLSYWLTYWFLTIWQQYQLPGPHTPCLLHMLVFMTRSRGPYPYSWRCYFISPLHLPGVSLVLYFPWLSGWYSSAQQFSYCLSQRTLFNISDQSK